MSQLNGSSNYEPRYQIRGDYEVSAVLKSTVPDADIAINGRLVDLSKHGAKLIVGPRVSLDYSYQIELAIEALRLRMTLAASVCWTEPLADGNYAIGCSLVPGIPEDFFRQFVAIGRIDRGTLPHQIVNKTQLAAVLEKCGEPFFLTLYNYSRGGFSTISEIPTSSDNRIHVLLDKTNDLIVANVLWQLNIDGEFVTGCSFANPKDYDRLDHYVTRMQSNGDQRLPATC